MKITITLGSNTCFDPKTKTTYANHNIVMSHCESEPKHRMDTGRVVCWSTDALSNLDKHVEDFKLDLQKRVYDDVVIDEFIVIDKLQRDLPHRR